MHWWFTVLSLFTEMNLMADPVTKWIRNNTACWIKTTDWIKGGAFLFELKWAPRPSVSQWWAPPAGKSFRKPSVHFHSCFQQCECCDSLLGLKDYWDQASPSSMPLAQAAKSAQSVPPAPRCLAEQPTRRTESKEAQGNPLIVNALGSSLAKQHEEGPRSQGCPTAPR